MCVFTPPVARNIARSARSPIRRMRGRRLRGSAAPWRNPARANSVIHGASAEWVDVFIDDARVMFRDARKLLGKNTYETEEAIHFVLAANGRRI